MLPLLLLAFIVVPLAELYVLIPVGHAIGTLPTIGLLLADSILGSLLMRSQGRQAWRRFNAALEAGRPPAKEVVDGALVILVGAFLLTPGFLTDIIGVLLLLPPTRAVLRAFLTRRLAARALAGGVAWGAGRFAAARRRRPAGFDVEGSATEVPADHHRLP